MKAIYHIITCPVANFRLLKINDISNSCWAYVGRTGYSAQTVSLGIPGCVAKGIAAHELMHVVGFQHEHSRSDRDKYVTILEHNIQKGGFSNCDNFAYTRFLNFYNVRFVMYFRYETKFRNIQQYEKLGNIRL